MGCGRSGVYVSAKLGKKTKQWECWKLRVYRDRRHSGKLLQKEEKQGIWKTVYEKESKGKNTGCRIQLTCVCKVQRDVKIGRKQCSVKMYKENRCTEKTVVREKAKKRIYMEEDDIYVES